MEDKEIISELQGMHVELARYNTLLDVHIKRTEMIEHRIKPIEDHVLFIRKLFEGLKWVAGLAVAIATIYKVFK